MQRVIAVLLFRNYTHHTARFLSIYSESGKKKKTTHTIFLVKKSLSCCVLSDDMLFWVLSRAHISFHHHFQPRQSSPPQWHTDFLCVGVSVCWCVVGFESHYSILMTICQVNSAIWPTVWVCARVWGFRNSQTTQQTAWGERTTAGGGQRERRQI